VRKENISRRQAMCILILFLFGSSVVIGVSSEASQDSWASLLIGLAFSIPVILVYSRLMKLFPETDLFDIMQTLFGKILGKILVALFAWYAFHLGALVVRNFSEFIEIVAMPETPQLPIMIALTLVTTYLAASGMETLGKWSVLMFPIIMFVVALTVVLALNRMDFTNLMPFLETAPATLLSSGFDVFSFPFAETVVFLCMAGSVRKEESPYKIYIRAVLFCGGVLLVIILRNVSTLGAAMVKASYFPSFTTARVIQVGDFLSRIEGSISMNFLVSGITKITLCLMVASKGLAHIFNIEDYRRILAPVALLMMALCATVYKNTMEMFGFLKYYRIYAFPFQVVIPVLIWIFAEFYRRRHRAPAAQNS
jgi:spore germination protein KB